MNDTIRDPVHRVRYAFEPQKEDLIVDCWIEPGGGLPEHLHPRQTERWSVVDGEVRFSLDGAKRVIGPADGEMLVRPNTRHALQNSSDRDAHLRCHVSPAYNLQGFLTDSAEAAQQGLFMKGGIPRSLRGARWAASFLGRHQADVVMSFPPRFAQRAMIALLGR